ncbi:hypothetical protein SCLCIDRAFT_34616 [Scleroderma citrinum Foug A]|uniref:Uncharacterized protein n=1 Tax=Scleroderma citrinum Foug A TaxID=1036808 RepID=A0A0C2YK56_9AGAM|nr:hypothetical protein SCLCIDRAFT_34616 [Scleroderma citrinum Foug A]
MASTDPNKAFCSPFILQLLANAHLCTCSGSIDVPVLQLSVKEYRARGVIALCLSALEHAIKIRKAPSDVTDAGKGAVNLFKGACKQNNTSKKGAAEHAFSEQHWGMAMLSYFQSVARWTPEALQDIVGMAHTVLQDDCDGDSSTDDQGEGNVEGNVDSHRFMCKSPMSFVYCTDPFTEFVHPIITILH